MVYYLYYYVTSTYIIPFIFHIDQKMYYKILHNLKTKRFNNCDIVFSLCDNILIWIPIYMNIVSLIILYQYRVHVLIAIFEVFNVKMFIELTDIIIIIIISTVIIHDICAVIAGIQNRRAVRILL